MRDGLQRMGRLHVHMTTALPRAPGGVISGMRSSCQVVITIDVAAAMAAGLAFFESANGVVLCEGPIPPRFFAEVRNYPSLTPFRLPAVN